MEAWAFPSGAHVTIHGLEAKPALNGMKGEVLHWIAEKERYAVRLVHWTAEAASTDFGLPRGDGRDVVSMPTMVVVAIRRRPSASTERTSFGAIFATVAANAARAL